MFEELMKKVKAEGFAVSEIVTEKCSSMNSIHVKHYPEGTMAYCSNHCSKTMHKDLTKIRQNKCQVTHHYLQESPPCMF